MKKPLDIKKLLILNLPYILLGLFATNFGEAWRMAQGADASAKMLSFFSTLPVALASWWPSLHPLDHFSVIRFTPEGNHKGDNAYAKLYPNNGAMTKGVTDETVDGMSIQKIDRMIELLREEKYQWKPARREYIPKKNGKKRPLGIPAWGDKLKLRPGADRELSGLCHIGGI